MKRIWKVVAVVAAFAVTCSSATAERILRLTLQLPITNVLGQNLVAFKEIVERESGGAIKVELYPSAQLYKDREVPQAVASGAIEMGIAPVSRFAPSQPAVNLFGLPFLFASNEEVAVVTKSGHPIRDTLDDELLKTGARPLWWQPFGLTVMLGRVQAPVHPSSLEAKRVRVFSDTMGKFVEAVGGVPILLSGSEQFDAYDLGMVDFGMTGVTSVKSRKLYDVMDHLVNTNHTASEFVVVINDALWRRLSAAEQAIIAAAAVQVETDLRMSYGQTHRRTLDWIVANTPMQVHDLDDEQRTAWRNASAPVYEWYLRQAGDTGQELLAEARKLQ